MDYSKKYKVTRTGIDTLYFTGNYPLNNEVALLEASRIFDNIILQHHKILFNKSSEINRNSSKVVIKDVERLGIYCEFVKKSSFIRFTVQFKGLFFIKENSFQLARFFIMTLMNELNVYYRLTRIDIAKDLLAPINGIFPRGALDKTSQVSAFNFKYRIAKYCEVKKDSSIETGFTIRSSRFEICIYDKKLEITKARNSHKIAYYQEYFSKFPDESSITRFELRLKQENCYSLYENFFNFSVDEMTICRQAYQLFSKRHSLKIRKNDSQDKDIRRWPIHPTWKYLFELEVIKKVDVKPLINPLFLSFNKDIDDVYKMLAEICVSEGIDENTLVSRLNPNRIQPLIKKAKEKQVRIDATAHYLKELSYKATLSLRKNRRMDGGSILSPSKHSTKPQLSTTTPAETPYISTNQVHSSSGNSRENELQND